MPRRDSSRERGTDDDEDRGSRGHGRGRRDVKRELSPTSLIKKESDGDGLGNTDFNNTGFGNGGFSSGGGGGGGGRGSFNRRGGGGSRPSSFRRDDGKQAQRFGGGGANRGFDNGGGRRGFSGRNDRNGGGFGGRGRGGRRDDRQRNSRANDFSQQQRSHGRDIDNEERRRRDESPKPVMKLFDPSRVPRSWRYFEHDSRDAPPNNRINELDTDRYTKSMGSGKRHRMYDPRADYSSPSRNRLKRTAPMGWRNNDQLFSEANPKKGRFTRGYRDEDYKAGGRQSDKDVDGIWLHDKFEELNPDTAE